MNTPTVHHRQETGRQRGRTVAQAWAGPLPDPESLARFDEIVPGTAKGLIDEFHAQSKHRRYLEKMTITTNNVTQVLGSLGAWVLFAGMIAGGIYLGLQGKDLAGWGMVTTAVVGGWKARKDAIDAKQRDLSSKR